MELTLEDVKRGAKREDFRAGVQMRLLMPRVSVHITRWVLLYAPQLRPNQITVVSLIVGVLAAAAFAAINPFLVALGLLAFHLHVLLDYVDGEVARCRGETSVAGAYLDLMTDRLTFPLFIFCAGLGAWRQLGDPALLIVGFVATFGLFLDKEAVDAWYRANTGATEVEDRYVAAPTRSAAGRWRGWLAIFAVMVRGLTAFLTYTAIAAALDATALLPAPIGGSWRALVLAAFAVFMPVGALVRFLYTYRRGVIPRRQQLL
jgi:phosphatidylglycerophosphate synthase